MMLPNLASKPQLNTRPVWFVTICATFLALLIGAVDLNIYLKSTRNLGVQISEKESLESRREELITELREQVDSLDTVPWKGLIRRVSSVNLILGEHRFSWVHLLDDLGRVLPWQVRLISIVPGQDEDGINLLLKAVSQDREGFLKFLDALVRDPCFSEPSPSRETWPESGQTVEYVFTLRVFYNPEGGSL